MSTAETKTTLDGINQASEVEDQTQRVFLSPNDARMYPSPADHCNRCRPESRQFPSLHCPTTLLLVALKNEYLEPELRALVAEVLGEAGPAEIANLLYQIAIDRREDWRLRYQAAVSAAKLA